MVLQNFNGRAVAEWPNNTILPALPALKSSRICTIPQTEPLLDVSNAVEHVKGGVLTKFVEPCAKQGQSSKRSL